MSSTQSSSPSPPNSNALHSAKHIKKRPNDASLEVRLLDA